MQGKTFNTVWVRLKKFEPEQSLQITNLIEHGESENFYFFYYKDALGEVKCKAFLIKGISSLSFS